MARQYRILHHRQSLAGGHWDLVENLIPYRSSSAAAPHGEGSLCAALEALEAEGWVTVMDLVHANAQPGESFILLGRENG
jgi:hypothetical protein